MIEWEGSGSRIVGLGHARPQRVLTNADVVSMVDTTEEWILSRTGVQTRHVLGPGESVTTLAIGAARMALEDAGAAAAEVDLVVVATATAEVRSPCTAGRVAAALGCPGPAVLDVNTACSGFEYALAVADQAIRAGTATCAVVIGAEALSTVTDWTDRATCILVGDGAGAVVVRASETAGISRVAWGSVPELTQAVRIEGEPARFSQDGRSVFRWAITEASRCARRVLEVAGACIDDIDVVALHQANLRIIEPVVEQLGGAAEKVVVRDVVESGNTSAASVPLGLARAWHRGDIASASTALLFGFGGGFTWAGLVVELPRR